MAQSTLTRQPTQTPLRALKSVLRTYFWEGVTHWLPALDDCFRPLAGLNAQPFYQEGYVATLLCSVIPAILRMAAERRQVHKPVCGGWAHQNLYTKADLTQGEADIPALKLTSSAELCALLREELRLLIRLLYAAQLTYWRDPAGFDWEKRHYAAMKVLLRIIHLCARLRERGTWRYAEQCLRYEVDWLWHDLFGANRPLKAGSCAWFLPRQHPPLAERRLLQRVLWERANGQAVPPAFAGLVAAWERGEVYPEVVAPLPASQ